MNNLWYKEKNENSDVLIENKNEDWMCICV